ncbi:NUDIX domain-containing protein [Allocoleopsis franciscana]|nr:NUDIX domain-containing protein [Allocoleopsis franciscana]
MGLFIQSDTVLMIHKMTGPEPDCWDLPGGGLQPGEPIIQALKREIREETGLSEIRVGKLLTLVEGFFPNWRGQLLHSLSIIYQCAVESDSVVYPTGDREVGTKGVQWLPVAELTPDLCSTRSWKALQALDLIKT